MAYGTKAKNSATTDVKAGAYGIQPPYESADQCWSRLDGVKQSLMLRCENYAALTIPKICLPNGFNLESTDQTHDYQSIGAQAVNNVTNKLMLAMFAPSRPFFKATVGEKTLKQVNAQGIAVDVDTILASLERQAVAKLEELGQRPKLYAAARHLVVTGNALMCLDDKIIRIMGIRHYCVKRTADGRVHTLIIKERVKFNELELEVQEAVLGFNNPDGEVDHYKLIQLQKSGNYLMTQWVGAQQLPMKFNGKWPADKLPYRVLVWDLSDEADYGTGLVEEYIGDLEAASILSEAVVNGGILGAEYRWLVNPTGLTSADDFNLSKNGDALPGKPEDIAPTQGGNPEAIKVAQAVLSTYETRIGRGFLVGSAVQRQAERVTAEEVRLTATELETSFGGVYSMLAPTIQTPIAWWLMAQLDKRSAGADLVITIVTGLDALSRNGDLDNLRQAIADMAALTQVPESLIERINWDVMWKFVCQGRGVDTSMNFLLTQAQVNAQQQAAQAQQAQVQANANIHESAGAKASENAVDPQQPTPGAPS